MKYYGKIQDQKDLVTKEYVDDGITDSLVAYRTASAQDVIDAEKIGDAPTDGKQYARQDGAWTEVTSGSGGGAYVSDTVLIFTAAVVSGQTLIL